MTHVHGMHGMGDNIHQRAIVREMTATQLVYLETPWPSIYHDLRGENLKLVCKPSTLRTQTKNMVREAERYDMAMAPQGFGDRHLRIWYGKDDLQDGGSILDAMCKHANVTSRDFRLPVPDAWKLATMEFLMPWNNGKPLMVYRPLVMRTEYGGCHSRNPLIDHYHDLFNAIRDRFYVVSVADLVPNIEWIVSKPIEADLELHRGELTFEVLAGLMSRAALSFASPGFATVLAQAVGTPSVCVFGGHECSTTLARESFLGPVLAIDPEVPCNCFSDTHRCRKNIDMHIAVEQLLNFVKENADDPTRGSGEVPRQLGLPLETVHEPRRTRNADHPDRVGEPEAGD